tara:strand:+ start:159 stop:578 length:420 start_codon:yes stop_codon:yes gene_type:complete
MERYLYFRTEATDANDDATGDSACWPASSLMGMQPTADSALTLYFKPMVRRTPSGNEPDTNASFDNHDTVILNLTTANTHLTAMKTIVHAINTGRVLGSNTVLPQMVIVANDDSGGTEYLSGSGITSCGVISVSAAYAN